ncbi:MAG: phospholipase D family protein [Gammaproteobacteria bacterium]
MTDTQNTALGRKAVPSVARHPGKSGFYPLSSGMDAFVARVALIANAERSLDIQYYIWHSDTTGRLLADQVLQAADRGVRVRLLLDDMDTEGKELGLNVLDYHPNIEIRLYNAFAHRGSRAVGFATDLTRVNRRMHNKSLTADNQATIVGGRNIGNEYFGATSHAEFSDLDVLGMGPIVKDVSHMFDLYWNSDEVIPISAFPSEEPVTKASFDKAVIEFHKVIKEERANPYIQAIRESDTLTRLQFNNMTFSWGKAELLYDTPDKVTATEVTADTHLAPQLGAFISKAKQEVIIVSPYFVPGDELVDYLSALAKRGVRVRILTNSLAANDVGVVHAGYMRYREDLLRNGVELYEFKPVLDKRQKNIKWAGSSRASLHAKTFGIDRRLIFVGSFNLDPRSIALNTELGAIFESPELATALAESLDRIVAEDAYRLELITLPAEEYVRDFEEYEIRWITQKNGKTVRYDVEPLTNWWQRFMAGFLSIFVIESFL